MVTEAYCPLGNLTNLETTEVIFVKNNMEQIMWSTAPVSMIQGVLAEFVSEGCWVKDKEDAKTECFESRVESWDVIKETHVLVILSSCMGISDSLLANKETWLTDESSFEIDGLNILMNCLHCS